MKEHLHKISLFVKNLDNEVLSVVQTISTTKHVKKGEYLLRHDEVCRHSYWIEQGVLRKFYVHEGKEHTTELLFENDIAVSLASYSLQKPGKEYIQVITEAVVSQTDFASFQTAKKVYPQLMELDLLMTEYHAVWLEKRLYEFHTLDATQRYKLLLQEHPHILHTVPLTYIASYLGISLETLSRIRAKI
jgi:CRP-like cAMP-binding protein